MALPLVEATNIRPGMRVLEIGAGSGQIATTLAKHWNVTVVTLEPWSDGTAIQAYAAQQGVGSSVLALRLKAQSMPFADNTFDAVISIGSFEMIGDERPVALKEVMRVAKVGARIGIAEPMCRPLEMPEDLAALDAEFKLGFKECFRTLDWNRQLFTDAGLTIVAEQYFPNARDLWMAYRALGFIKPEEEELILRDEDRWISLGMMVGEK